MNEQTISPWDVFYVNIPLSLSDVLKKQYKRLGYIAPALEDPVDLQGILAAMSKAIDEVNRPGFSRHSPGSLRNAFQTLPVTADC